MKSTTILGIILRTPFFFLARYLFTNLSNFDFKKIDYKTKKDKKFWEIFIVRMLLNNSICKSIYRSNLVYPIIIIFLSYFFPKILTGVFIFVIFKMLICGIFPFPKAEGGRIFYSSPFYYSFDLMNVLFCIIAIMPFISLGLKILFFVLLCISKFYTSIN